MGLLCRTWPGFIKRRKRASSSSPVWKVLSVALAFFFACCSAKGDRFRNYNASDSHCSASRADGMCKCVRGWVRQIGLCFAFCARSRRARATRVFCLCVWAAMRIDCILRCVIIWEKRIWTMRSRGIKVRKRIYDWFRRIFRRKLINKLNTAGKLYTQPLGVEVSWETCLDKTVSKSVTLFAHDYFNFSSTLIPQTRGLLSFASEQMELMWRTEENEMKERYTFALCLAKWS